MPLMQIQYIGSKPRKADNITNSGAVWNYQGDVQTVSQEVGLRLLRHPDIWARVGDIEAEHTANTVRAVLETIERKAEQDSSPEQRLLAIKNAIQRLAKSPASKRRIYFGEDGKPRVESIEALVGFSVLPEERDEAVEELESPATGKRS
jgi:hypothetical protein